MGKQTIGIALRGRGNDNTRGGAGSVAPIGPDVAEELLEGDDLFCIDEGVDGR